MITAKRDGLDNWSRKNGEQEEAEGREEQRRQGRCRA